MLEVHSEQIDKLRQAQAATDQQIRELRGTQAATDDRFSMLIGIVDDFIRGQTNR